MMLYFIRGGGGTLGHAPIDHCCGTSRPGRSRCRARAAALAEPAAHHGGAVRGRRAGRSARPHHRAISRRRARQSGGDRECPRRRRHAGLAARRPCQSRRLHLPARLDRHACAQPVALQASALRCGRRFRARRADRAGAAGAGHAQGLSRGEPRAVHRLCQGRAGAPAVRLRRRRHFDPYRLRSLESGHRHRHRARALSGRRGGAARFDGRAHRLYVQHPVGRRAGFATSPSRRWRCCRASARR